MVQHAGPNAEDCEHGTPMASSATCLSLRSGSWLAHVHPFLPWGLGADQCPKWVVSVKCLKLPGVARDCGRVAAGAPVSGPVLLHANPTRGGRPRRCPATVTFPAQKRTPASGGNACTSIISFARTGPLEAPVPKPAQARHAQRPPVSPMKQPGFPVTLGVCAPLSGPQQCRPAVCCCSSRSRAGGRSRLLRQLISPHLLAGKVQFPGGRLLSARQHVLHR